MGFGYELVHSRMEGELVGAEFERSVSYAGFELLHLQAGADFGISSPVGIGPFASFSLAQYSTCTEEVNGTEGDCEITRGVLHEWLVFGVRGTLGL